MTSPSTQPPRRFVPNEIDFADLDQLQPLYALLLERLLETSVHLERWLEDYSELTAAVSEYRRRR
jgi:hypothetical protein